VVKSLFEEVLSANDWGISSSTTMHPEAYDYVQSELQLQYGPDKYCEIIQEAKDKVEIPIIASINCRSSKWWPEFAEKIERAGADALELNVYKVPTDPKKDSSQIENEYYDIVKMVKQKINIPVALKISNSFTSLPHFVDKLEQYGLDGLVLFNRFTVPDIDIDKLNIHTTFSFSDQDDIFQVLRWIAVLREIVELDISATSGIHTPESAIKLILAGASTIQLASVLYKNGLKKINEILFGIVEWMEKYKLSTINDFKGKVTFAKNFDTEMFLRTQFMEKVRGIE
jgi:dihydroorotate dehydrogenase (fumarate)